MRKLLFFVVALVFFLPTSKGQIVGTDVFLQGRYVEAGLRQNFAFGAPSVPSTYHPIGCCSSMGITSPTSPLAMVYDIGLDGWATGTPNGMGDFVIAGYPAEGWVLQVGPTHYINDYMGSFALPGLVTAYSSAAGITRASWAGTISLIDVRKEARLDTNATSIVMKVKLVNAGSVSTLPLYYMRYCDPDNVSNLSGGSSTQNTIVYQADALNRSFVNASTTTPYVSNFGLGAIDSRALVAVVSGLTPTSSPSAMYAGMVSGTGGAGLSLFHAGSTSFADQGICLIFSLGSLAPGDSTEFSYAYIFSGVAGFDSAFIPPCSGTPVAGAVAPNTTAACTTTGVVLTLSGASVASDLTYQWQSSPDSTTWTNLAGATTTTYSFSGLTTTTYYRCRVTCPTSASVSFTPGKKISYSTACPCLHSAGVPNPSTATACSTTAIALNNTGYTLSAGVTLQWQSSPDSATWTDISGATTVPFTFSGLTATTYYRLKATCTATGLALYSAGRKITYTASCTCSGAPVAATAIASTSYCSSCALTLDITGLSAMAGYTYQWQRSLDGVTSWANISGATTVPYTYSPTESYYYRCNVKCTASGLTTSSSSVLVAVPYTIVDDSVRASPDTACSGQLFYVRVSGISPLLSVVTTFGDGTSSTTSLTVSGTGRYANIAHHYSTPGSYTVKHVLYHGTVAHDSVTFTYTHADCKILPLKLYVDANTNCTKDYSEQFLLHPVLIKVDSNSVPIDTVSIMSGLYYKVFGPAGTVYSFTLISSAVYPVCPSTGTVHDTIVAGMTGYIPKMIGVYCTSSAFDLTQYVSFVAHSNVGRFTILPRNLLCLPTTATQFMSVSPKYKYTSISGIYTMPTASATSDHSVTWNTSALSCTSAGPLLSTKFYPATVTSLTIGDTVHTHFEITPITGDGVPTNNVIDRVDTVVGPYDPNYIQVLPQGCFDHDTTLEYTVHFENYGTDTAHNVHVMDTLSPNVDFRSLEILASSAAVDIYPFEAGGLKIVKFDFPNIKLLDSSWHGLNEGMFVYKIKTKAGLLNGQTISARVGIYFDNNEVVMTNTVQNTKGCPVTTAVSELPGRQVLLYPNPATDNLTIRVRDAVFTSLSITNAIGQEMISKAMNGSELSVDVRALPAGVYQVTLRGMGGSEVRKFVKW